MSPQRVLSVHGLEEFFVLLLSPLLESSERRHFCIVCMPMLRIPGEVRDEKRKQQWVRARTMLTPGCLLCTCEMSMIYTERRDRNIAFIRERVHKEQELELWMLAVKHKG